MLLAKSALDCKQYNSEHGYITWEDCSLRKWLNNHFYDTAFSSADKEKIVTAHNENPDTWELYKPWITEESIIYGAEGGDDTDDKVFLLSWTEARDYLDGTLWEYDLGVDNYNKKLLCMPMAYAAAQGVKPFDSNDDRYPYPSDTTGCCYWWLRSPGYYQREEFSPAASVSYVGAIYSYLTTADFVGVRPALLID